jgi:hypothetical protein
MYDNFQPEIGVWILMSSKILSSNKKSFYKLDFMDDSKNMFWQTHSLDDDNDDGGLRISPFSRSNFLSFH